MMERRLSFWSCQIAIFEADAISSIIDADYEMISIKPVTGTVVCRAWQQRWKFFDFDGGVGNANANKVAAAALVAAVLAVASEASCGDRLSGGGGGGPEATPTPSPLEWRRRRRRRRPPLSTNTIAAGVETTAPAPAPTPSTAVSRQWMLLQPQPASQPSQALGSVSCSSNRRLGPSGPSLALLGSLGTVRQVLATASSLEQIAAAGWLPLACCASDCSGLLRYTVESAAATRIVHARLLSLTPSRNLTTRPGIIPVSGVQVP